MAPSVCSDSLRRKNRVGEIQPKAVEVKDKKESLSNEEGLVLRIQVGIIIGDAGEGTNYV